MVGTKPSMHTFLKRTHWTSMSLAAMARTTAAASRSRSAYARIVPTSSVESGAFATAAGRTAECIGAGAGTLGTVLAYGDPGGMLGTAAPAMSGRPGLVKLVKVPAVGAATVVGSGSTETAAVVRLVITAGATAGAVDVPRTVRTRAVGPDVVIAGATTGAGAGPGSPDVGEAGRA